jgi:lipoprotein-releasing system permease protein
VGAGVLALAVGAALVGFFRFERFVGVRYLRRARGALTRLGVWGAAAVTVGAGAAFLAMHGHQRDVETLAVVVALLGAIVTMLLALLRLFSVFTTVSTMGVVLGVASLVVVMAVTSGFQRDYQEKVLALNAHLIVTAYGPERDMEEAEREADGFITKLRTMPGLTRISKFSFSEVMIGPVGSNLKGIELTDGAPELRRAVVAGALDDLARPARCGDPGAGRIVLGTELARKIRATVGRCVNVLVPFARDAQGGPVAMPFEVVALTRMGFYEFDARFAFIPLADARRLGNARQSVVGVEMRFTDPALALSAEDEVHRRLNTDLHIMDWQMLNRTLFMTLTMQKLIISFVLAFIIVVAAFNIVASLMLVVLAKSREIAILTTIGAPAASVLRIFVVAGSFVGFVGTGLGIAYGLLVCGVARVYGYPLDPKVYLIGSLPVQISLRELLFVAATTQLVCFLATIYPAWRAARLPVVDGLRQI